MTTKALIHKNGKARTSQIVIPPPKAVTLDDLRGPYLQQLNEGYEARRNGRPLGPVIGIAEKFDKQCRGYLTPGLHILVGMPGSGKSALAAQIAAKAECGVLYVTYEMSVEELMNRNISRETGTWIDKFHDYMVGPNKAAQLYERTKTAMPWVVHFDGTRPGSDLTELKNAAIAAKRNAGSPHLLIIIDSVHAMVRNGGLVGPDGRNVSEYTGMNLAVSRLMGIAHELKAVLLLIGEQSKTNMNGTGMSSADSRALEYAPNLFIALECDLGKKSDCDGNLNVTAHFLKNRRGEPRKKVMLNFHGRTMTFGQGTFAVEDDEDEDDE